MTTTTVVPRRHPKGAGLAPLAGYLARRLLSAAVVVAIVSMLVFAFVHAAPGGPERSIGGRFATAEQLVAIREQYRLNDPLWTQYGQFVSSALGLDFGTSYSMREPVTDSISRAASTTVPLVLFGWLAALLIGTALGVVSARHAGGAFDRGVLGFTVVGASAPIFATAILLSYVFGVALGWLPTLGEGDGGMDRIRHLVLPGVTLAIAAMAAITKVTKVRVGQVLEADHITFATARGLPPRGVLVSEVLRNSGVQLVTQAGAVLVAMLSAVILVEEVFDLDGLGSLLIQAITARDIPLIQAITLFTCIFIVAVNLVVDLVCMAIDPRLRIGRGGVTR
ncbi:peptide/nickel transport system permease protein [Prauserella muralis]|nr:peptide/nickel transport system permease protein [Prauserella muralis]